MGTKNGLRVHGVEMEDALHHAMKKVAVDKHIKIRDAWKEAVQEWLDKQAHRKPSDETISVEKLSPEWRERVNRLVDFAQKGRDTEMLGVIAILLERLDKRLK